MKRKRQEQEAQLVRVYRAPNNGSQEVGPEQYSCCECQRIVHVSEALRSPSSISYGAVFCPQCAAIVRRCYGLSLGPIVPTPVERLNHVVGIGGSGGVPTLLQLGFREASASVSDSGLPVLVDDDGIVEVD